MLVRPACPADKSAIVELLRKSMRESAIEKSEALWEWKHEQSPFGPSYVLVAEEDNELVGVRAFMRWDWLRRGTVYQAVRAVDTATHPNFQGKGIFKMLTLQQSEICRQQGVRFVFNTPNLQSLPGYLKMGWVQQGKMPLKFKILRPFSIIWAKIFERKKSIGAKEIQLPYQKWTSDIFGLFDKCMQQSNHLSTVLSPQYISWRYANNPLFTYRYFTDHKNYLLISRIKLHGFAKELRLVDFVKLNPAAADGYINGHIKTEIKPFCHNYGIDFISFSGQQYRENTSCFKWMGVLPIRQAGPMVTLRDLTMKDNFHHLLKVKNWCYSIGDLELF